MSKKINELPKLQTTYELNLNYHIHNQNCIRKSIFDKIDWILGNSYDFINSNMSNWFEEHISNRNYNIVLLGHIEYTNDCGNKCYWVQWYRKATKEFTQTFLSFEKKIKRYQFKED